MEQFYPIATGFNEKDIKYNVTSLKAIEIGLKKHKGSNIGSIKSNI